jgi:exonuclease 3'-5' domain-containing protein 1
MFAAIPAYSAGPLKKADSTVHVKPLDTSPGLTIEVKATEVSTLAASLERVRIQENSSPTIVSTTVGLDELIEAIDASAVHPPSLFVDLEGVNLSRNGTISILQIFILPRHHTYLVDIHTLKETAFTHQTVLGRTLKDILESSSIQKVFFNVRNDSDALYSHFGIKLAAVQDLQLMELATRSFPKRRVNGLAKCIEHDAPMNIAERRAWNAAKEKGKDLFAPERGGTYEVFNIRPLPEEIMQYCVQDAQFLPKLWEKYNRKLNWSWEKRIEKEVENRITLSQSPTFNGKGPHMALAPKVWA